MRKVLVGNVSKVANSSGASLEKVFKSAHITF